MISGSLGYKSLGVKVRCSGLRVKGEKKDVIRTEFVGPYQM